MVPGGEGCVLGDTVEVRRGVLSGVEAKHGGESHESVLQAGSLQDQGVGSDTDIKDNTGVASRRLCMHGDIANL